MNDRRRRKHQEDYEEYSPPREYSFSRQTRRCYSVPPSTSPLFKGTYVASFNSFTVFIFCFCIFSFLLSYRFFPTYKASDVLQINQTRPSIASGYRDTSLDHELTDDLRAKLDAVLPGIGTHFLLSLCSSLMKYFNDYC